MRILFIRYGLYPPELFAGTELALHWLCRTLIANGHEVVVAANTDTSEKDKTTVDRKCGYPVYRASNLNESVHHGLTRFEPDAVVLSESGPWMALLPPEVSQKPAVIYEHQWSLSVKDVPDVFKTRAVYVANSEVTSANLMKECGIVSIIVPPLFGVDQYAGLQCRGDSVLFVSLQDRKGADVAIRLAQERPRAKFVFVESWTQYPDHTEALRKYVGGIPNVTLLPNQQGLAHILPDIKLLLMPSRSQEAWGRTATEAQICGIPVLGSSRGNLPVTIGPGGVTLDPDDPMERWLGAFDRIMNDPAYYAELSRKAREHGGKFLPEVERAYRTFEEALKKAVARQRA